MATTVCVLIIVFSRFAENECHSNFDVLVRASKGGPKAWDCFAAISCLKAKICCKSRAAPHRLYGTKTMEVASSRVREERCMMVRDLQQSV